MAWVHLTTAPDQLTAELWLTILHDHGVAAMIRPSDAVSFLGLSAFGCRIQVAEADLELAQYVLGDEAGAAEERS